MLSIDGVLRVEIGPAFHPVVGSIAEGSDITAFAVAYFRHGATVLSCHEWVGKIERGFVHNAVP